MTDSLGAPPLPAAVRWQVAAIDDIVVRTPRVTSFFLALAQPFAFRAGQHVDVRLTAADGYQAQRSYSIASAPAEIPTEPSHRIELAIERLDRGEVSSYFAGVARVADEIEIRGPIGGHFVWSSRDGTPTLLIAGGSGVAPLMSMIRHREIQRATAPLLLLYSARVWEELIFRDELIHLDQRNDGFRALFVLTRDQAQREGHFARRIDAAMLRDVLTAWGFAPADVFICGGNTFVEAAAQALIESGVAAGVIRTERYGQ